MNYFSFKEDELSHVFCLLYEDSGDSALMLLTSI